MRAGPAPGRRIPAVLVVVLWAGCGESHRDLDAGRPPAPGQARTRAAVVCLGDSLTAGYGLDPEEAYPALLQNRVDELGVPFEVVNAGVSGDTTSAGLGRLDWLLRNRIEVLVLALGGNDALRGISPDLVAQNLRAIIQRTRERYPDVRILLAGMKAPPNLGPSYAEQFAAVYPAVAASEEVALLPFLLEGVAGDPELNQPDGTHPDAAGQAIVAASVWEHLRPLLETVPE